MVELKAILRNNPLAIGEGPLPRWLRNKKGLNDGLDTYNDDLCISFVVWLCIAAHAKKTKNTRRTRELAKSFLQQNLINPRELTSKHFFIFGYHFIQGMAVYNVEGNEQNHRFILRYLPTTYDRVGFPSMKIRIYNQHAFLNHKHQQSK